MGCVQSTGVDDEAKARNDEIENQLKRDRMMAKNEIKMLLLGAGESGKMKLIHHGGYNEQERDSYKEIIFSNTIQSMRAILEALPQLDIALNPGNDARRNIILSLPPQIEADVLPRDVSEAIRTLWRDAAIKEAVSRSREFQLNDSAIYYFNAIDRMSAPNYLPTDQDILRSRVKTTGITETTFKVGELTYKLFDVGGQRSERKKWRWGSELQIMTKRDDMDHLVFDLGCADDVVKLQKLHFDPCLHSPTTVVTVTSRSKVLRIPRNPHKRLEPFLAPLFPLVFTARSRQSLPPLRKKMKFTQSFLAFVFVATAVLAQDETTTSSAAESSSSAIASLTPCIIGCIQPAAEAVGCSYTDPSCVCVSTDFQTAATACLQANCTAEEVQTAVGLQEAECATVSGTGTDSASSAAATSTDNTSSTSAHANATSSGTTAKPTSTTPSGTTSQSSSSTSSSATATKTNAAMTMRRAEGVGAGVAGLVVMGLFGLVL
ncbi:hypothetical protein H0H93_005652 [Arthromyces matolae]|nr:hypothetical protein H0H93_005652 [Arthromyces matolae]